jgi:hypothetical protein
MGKLVLMAIVGVGIFGTLYSSSIQSSLQDSQKRVSGYQYEVLSRNTALAGYTIAKQELAENFVAVGYAGDAFSGTFSGGTYEVEVTVSGETAEVVSVGTVTDGTGAPTATTITATFTRTEEDGEEEMTAVPAFMEYMLLTEEDLRLSGNAGAASIYDTSDEGATLNANMHTNKNLTVNGTGNRRVMGFGSYVGTASGKHAQKFTPNYNPLGKSSTYKTSYVDIPTFDIGDYLGRVTVDKTSNGDVSITGTQTLGGTRDNPYIWHIKGNLSTTGNTTINGYAVFLVEGTISLNSVTVGSSGYTGGDESSIAFYAGGDVTIQGNATVWGQFYTTGDFTMGGNPTLYGSITSRSDVWVHGNPTLWFRKASTALTGIWNESSGGDVTIQLAAYHEK